MLINLISWCIFGLIVGAIARLVLPGSDPIGCLGTILVGIAGSLMGGFIGHLLLGRPHDEFQPAGFIGAILGAIVVLILYRRFITPTAR